MGSGLPRSTRLGTYDVESTVTEATIAVEVTVLVKLVRSTLVVLQDC